jgi:bla regulator protein blaR1
MEHASLVLRSAPVSLALAALTLAAQAPKQAAPQPSPIAAWQSAAGGKMSFEVASVRRAEPGPFLRPSFELGVEDTPIPPGGRFFASFALIDYIQFAYKIMPAPEQQAAMLAALPQWAKTEYFVIQAEAPGNPTKDQMRLMMQALLADRFRLRVHFATRVEPVFGLVLVRKGRLGPRIRPHAEGLPCGAPWTPPADRTAPTVAPGGFTPVCGSFDGLEGPNHIFVAGARNATLEQFADYLAWEQDFGKPVVDQTGLSGRFDFTLAWTPERQRPGDDGAALYSGGPTLIEALKEQFGMKLVPARAPVQILVIDHVEPPTPN